MTDILLCKQHVAVIKVSETEIEVPVCCVEIGVGKPATCTISVDGVMRIWPKKLGELLASMHLFGVLDYTNKLTGCPESVKVKVYGMLAVRSIGCMLLRMTVDEDGCCVQLIHEGGCLSMASALQYLAQCVRT